MANLLEFLNKKNSNKINHELMLEGFKNNDFDKALQYLTSLFKKKIDNIHYAGINQVEQGDDQLNCHTWIVDNKRCFCINFKLGKSVSPYSIDFYNNLDLIFRNKAKSKLTIYTFGNSIVHFIPTIIQVATSNQYNLTNKDIESNSQKLNESIYYIGALKHTIVENLTNEEINTIFNIVTEDEEVKAYKKELANKKSQAWAEYVINGKKDRSKFKNLEDEYNAVCKAIKGGASTMKELQFAIKKDVVSYPVKDEAEQKLEAEVKKAGKNPDQAFKELSKYVKMVAKGLQPSLIVSGGPGLGKTYKITRQLEAMGYKDEHNMHIIKGKMSTRALYADLYVYRQKGLIIVFDDADSCIGPKAAEDSINILKAALDSSDVRKISYHVKGEIEDERVDQPIPHSFTYEGGIIVITNYSIGQIDTALKGRSFVQELNFTTELLLQMIKDMMPSLNPNLLSMTAKNKAYDYLVEMNKSNKNIDISPRTFMICAKCFMMVEYDGDMTDDDAKSMIEEQMLGQAKKEGKHF